MSGAVAEALGMPFASVVACGTGLKTSGRSEVCATVDAAAPEVSSVVVEAGAAAGFSLGLAGVAGQPGFGAGVFFVFGRARK